MRRDLEQAIAADPRAAEAYRRRGMLNQREGRLDDAERDFARAAALEPGNTRYVLGNAYFA